ILYVGISSGYWYSLQTIMEASGLLIIFTFISSTLMVFLTTLLKSVNAFGALSGILGTFIGFVSGIYMPLFILGKGTTFVASVIPFTHMTIMLRNVLLREPLAVMMSEYPIPPQVLEHVKMHYGINEIGVFGMDVPMIFIMLFSGLLSFVLLFFTYRRMTKKISK
ncbi:MAG: hypothetical protein IH571_06665, partial [Acholeplasmataceae bacterium]|nr:hypothetical protein [Acholeplasmataceae bacterium]